MMVGYSLIFSAKLKFPHPLVYLLPNTLGEILFGESVDGLILFINMALQKIRIPGGFRQNIELVNRLGHIAVPVERIFQLLNMQPPEVVLHHHPVLNHFNPDLPEMPEHFGEEQLFLFAVVMPVGVVPGKINHLSEILIIDLPAFENAAAGAAHHPEKLQNVLMLFYHNINTVHAAHLSPPANNILSIVCRQSA